MQKKADVALQGGWRKITSYCVTENLSPADFMRKLDLTKQTDYRHFVH